MNLDQFTTTNETVKPTEARKDLVQSAIEYAAQNVQSGVWNREVAVKALAPIVGTVIPAKAKGKGHAEKLREFVNESIDDAMSEDV